MQHTTDTDLELLVEKLPPHIAEPLGREQDTSGLLEIILDLGRVPEARLLDRSYFLSEREVAEEDIQYVLQRIGSFGGDNRAGIERTLHRISAIRNRNDKVVGLTLRVGRAVYGTIKIIEDLVLTGNSVLLLGRPGVGKTTMLREVARVLADDAHKRVVVVDTSNEIGGDGDIPHPGIGRARRMQVPSPVQQHSVMIEAVENHMPEVIVIDEIGTELEANASRTIAERGVQLVATAHGNTLENLIMNPTLSDLVGGIQTVTLGDDEARRRRTQKTVLERRAPPTFDILVEIQGWSQVAVQSDVADVVDRMLRGLPVSPQLRTIGEDGAVQESRPQPKAPLLNRNGGGSGRFEAQPDFYFRPATPRREAPAAGRETAATEETVEAPDPVDVTHILPYGVNLGKLQQALRETPAPVELVGDIRKADLLLTTKSYYRKRTQALKEAEAKGKPVYVLRKNTLPQVEQFLQAISRSRKGAESQEFAARGVKEAQEAATKVSEGTHEIELRPQGSYIRHLQHQIAEEHGLASSSTGRDPARRVVFYRS